MGSQVTTCGCTSDEKALSEVSLTRKTSTIDPKKIKDAPDEEPKPLRVEAVEESISNSPSKKSSAKDTSHSTNPFKSLIDLEWFSPQAHLILESMELDLPDKIRSREDVRKLLESEERREQLMTENFNYFGGVLGKSKHGLGYSLLT